MIPRTLADLGIRLGADLHADGAVLANGFATDNREVKPGDVFLAIKGERSDGHAYVKAAIDAGAVAAIVERPVDRPHLLVGNLVEALARMALTFRAEFHGPVVGITGSVGKTTTKELVAAALSPLGPVLKNEGNRNTEYTSPLVWADLEPSHRVAAIEMGMRGFGQIAHLALFSRPTIGLITNVGYAHLELVETREGIAKAKGELLQALPKDGVAILWQSDDFLDYLKNLTTVRTSTFGFDPEADCSIREYWAHGDTSSTVVGVCYGVPWKAEIPNIGRHIAISAAAAVLAAVEAGARAEDAGQALIKVRFPGMRMQFIDRGGVRILVDTYNASPPSMVAALETFDEIPVSGRRLAVLGEMRELGAFTEAAHTSLGQEPTLKGFDAILFYGEPTRLTQEAAIEAGIPPDRLTHADTIDQVREFVNSARPGDAILIKGSRSLELERALA